MQYWLYAFKICNGNMLIGKYDTIEEAKTEMNRVDSTEYEYADIIKMEWGKEPRWICGVNFEKERPFVKKR